MPNHHARRLIPCSAQPGRLISKGVEQLGCRRAICTTFAQKAYKALHVASMCCAVLRTNHQAVCGWELGIDEAMERVHWASVHARCQAWLQTVAEPLLSSVVHGKNLLPETCSSNPMTDCPLCAACNVYVSEGRDAVVIQQLQVRLLYLTTSMTPTWHAQCCVCSPHEPKVCAACFAQDAAEQDKHVVLAHTFVDSPYNRTGFTLASACEDKVQALPSFAWS